MSCQKCKLLNEFYDQVPETDRNYWLYTELFVMLHGGDVCTDQRGEMYVLINEKRNED